MSSLLSERFCGDKIVKQEQFRELTTTQQPQLSAIIHKVFSRTISRWDSLGQPLLITIFTDFIILNLEEALDLDFDFIKMSTWLELTARVFQQSFVGHLSSQASYKLFGDLLIRHSLFRPPHSVCIFSAEDVKALTTFWLETFDSHYKYYEHCFATSLNNVIRMHQKVSPSTVPLSSGKALHQPPKVLAEVLNQHHAPN